MVQKIKNAVNQEFLTYLVFLVIAITIWYLNALSEDYTAELKFAVKYTDLPDDKVLANMPPDRLYLTMNAQGFTLLKYRYRLIFSPITLDASYNSLRRRNNAVQGEYYLSTQSAFNRISAQLRSDIDLRHIEPDTLDFVFTETIQKDIPVKSALQLQFEKGFLPKGAMNIEPAKVTVTGPQTIIDTLQFIYTKTKVFRRLKDTLRTSIELQPALRLRYSLNEVKITQAIQRYTEATIPVAIESINMPDGLTMRTFPSSITISCMVPIADYEKLQSFMFRAVVDYNSVKNATDNQTKARVEITLMPDYVTDVSFRPNTVDFIIEK